MRFLIIKRHIFKTIYIFYLYGKSFSQDKVIKSFSQLIQLERAFTRKNLTPLPEPTAVAQDLILLGRFDPAW